ncbi:MAG: glycerophosphodiester phosphodiesterase [Acidobacteria bacterium]|nr:MAG: glycerophosphodiester phosphodiesterase [Acidobacteriota bacterium]
MWNTTRGIVGDALRDLRRSWRSLALADVAWKLVAFALLTPGTVLTFRWLLSRAGSDVLTDAEILRFFVTTRQGLLALVGGGAVVVAITALEVACLMAVGLATARGLRLDARSALVFAGSRAPRILALAAHIVLRLLAGLVPFAVAGGLVYLALLRPHDVNYYLSRKPPAFWAALSIAGLLLAALVALLVRAIARWALSLPLVLFEDVPPRRALGESGRRSAGSRAVVLSALAAWAVTALALVAVAGSVPGVLGRGLAPAFAGSLPAILAFVAGLALLWGALALAAGVANVSLFAVVLTRLYLAAGDPRDPRLPEGAGAARASLLARVPRRLLAAAGAVAVLSALGLFLLAASPARESRAVAVIAHRGSSAAAPENSLAAFRLAADQEADYVELDVQESADGEVLVVHDSDLMKAAGSPLKVWETDAARLRSVDIGSRVDPRFASERVPTLAEALAVCKGRAKVIVELKSYGHAVRLEERVVEVVEAAGMAQDCLFMSLDHDMVRRLKELRPSWRCGVLAAKAVGDAAALEGDFLAVEKRMATVRLARRVHRTGREVYAWTVDDPAWMLSLMSRGVDGLITNRPDVARQAVARRAGMSEAERVLVALLVRLGAGSGDLSAGETPRP